MATSIKIDTETGQHLSDQEVQDWLDSRGTNNEIEAPKGS